jgi:hypothetical protein
MAANGGIMVALIEQLSVVSSTVWDIRTLRAELQLQAPVATGCKTSKL